MKMKYKTVKMIELSDWDDCVENTYNRIYSFQQQDGCRSRGTFCLEVPSDGDYDYENDTVPEIVNGPEQGVSFKAWLERDPLKPIENQESDHDHSLWWRRNFYPEVHAVADDLYKKGLLEAGEYLINIDW